MPGATGLTFTPDFVKDNRYFIICKSVLGSDTIISNEVMVEVIPFSETQIGTIPFYHGGTIKAGDYDRTEIWIYYLPVIRGHIFIKTPVTPIPQYI